MPYKRPRLLATLAWLFVAALPLGAIGGYQFLANPTSTDYADEVQIEAVLSSIREHGPAAAARAFASSTRGLPYEAAHDRLHAFGQALIRALGKEGIRHCGSFESSGCIHGALIEARTALGMSDAQMLDVCLKDISLFQYFDCAHGWGHVLGYTAGESAALEEALAECTVFTTVVAVQSCQYGVAMERFMAITDRRAHTSSGAESALCRSLSPEHRAACYFSLSADGWSIAPGDDQVAREAKLRADCDSASDARDRAACFHGIGHFLSHETKSLQELRTICHRIAGDSPGTNACIESGVAWVHIHHGAETGARVCASAGSDGAPYCTNRPRLRERPFFPVAAEATPR